MNDSNPLEKQLASWTPRRPSAKLKARLFSLAANGHDHPLAAATRLSWSWFAPVTAMLMLVNVARNDHNMRATYLDRSSSQRMLAALSMSNQSAAAWFTSADSFDRNCIPAATFTSTNASRSPSTMGFLLFKTNSLIR